jgi:hypothetical protein
MPICVWNLHNKRNRFMKKTSVSKTTVHESYRIWSESGERVITASKTLYRMQTRGISSKKIMELLVSMNQTFNSVKLGRRNRHTSKWVSKGCQTLEDGSTVVEFYLITGLPLFKKVGGCKFKIHRTLDFRKPLKILANACS